MGGFNVESSGSLLLLRNRGVSRQGKTWRIQPKKEQSNGHSPQDVWHQPHGRAPRQDGRRERREEPQLNAF